MAQPFVCKVVYITEDGDKLEYTANISAESHDAAVSATTERLTATLRDLAAAGDALEIDSTKVERNK